MREPPLPDIQCERCGKQLHYVVYDDESAEAVHPRKSNTPLCFACWFALDCWCDDDIYLDAQGDPEAESFTAQRADYDRTNKKVGPILSNLL